MPRRRPAVEAPRTPGTPARLAALLHRYLVHDLVGWIGALLLGCAAQLLGGSLWAVAVAATAGDNLGFYGSAWLREIRRERRQGIQSGPRARLRRLVQEFALAEFLDGLAVRPLVILGVSVATGSAVAGITIGGLAADLLFYACAWSLRPGARRA